MSTTSKIEWTEITWNPTTGCDRISPGCDNCYALRMSKRLKAMGSAHYQTDGDPRTSGPGFGVAVHEDAFGEPLHWARPRIVFVNSMSDLGHARIHRTAVAEIFAVMALTPQHTYQVLTKRPGRLARMLTEQQFAQLYTAAVERRLAEDPKLARRFPDRAAVTASWPLANVWIGTSVESDEYCTRVAELRKIPAAVRFLSLEPLLGLLASLNLAGVDWVIAGGESGPGARPMHPDWARTLRDQCVAADVPFFFKQWGDWEPTGWRGIGHGRIEHHSLGGEPARPIIQVGEPIDELGHRVLMRRVGKHLAGRELDGRTWDQYPAAAVIADA